MNIYEERRRVYNKAVAEMALRDNPALARAYAKGDTLYTAPGACWGCCEKGKVQEGHAYCHLLEPGLRRLVAVGIADLELGSRFNPAWGWTLIVEIEELRRALSWPAKRPRGRSLEEKIQDQLDNIM